MPRMKILNSVERGVFDSPPIFNSAERKRCFDFPAPLKDIATSLRTSTNQVVFLMSCGYFKATKRFYPVPTFHQRDLAYVSDRRYLNHNERTHQLQRQIRHAGSGSTRGRRHEELSAQSHCLALCTNLVMAYNTSHLQRTLDSWRKGSGREIDASIQRFISPMGFVHINFNGVIVFPFDHYRAQLLSPRGRGRIVPIRGG